MKKHLLIPIILLFLAPMIFASDRIPFNDGWKFKRGDAPSAHWRLIRRTIAVHMDARTGNDLLVPPRKDKSLRGVPPYGIEWAQPNFDDSQWSTIDLPHDWAIAGPFSEENDVSESYLPTVGTGWYRKSFFADPKDQGKKIFLDFDGSMSYTIVYVNGQFCGGWPYGYTSFRVDCTDCIKWNQKNSIAIRVSHPRFTSRWYTGAGIYRNLWLIKSDPIHIAQWGVFVQANKYEKGSAPVKVNVSVKNETQSARKIAIQTTIFQRNSDGKKTGTPVAKGIVRNVNLPAHSVKTTELPIIKLEKPNLWSLESPSMYVAETNLFDEKDGTSLGSSLDREETPFGVREIKYIADKGFFLNGKLTEIKGTCLHHDLGSLGAAINIRAMERQLQLLREAGCNAIRLSHNPAAPEMMDLLDRLGFLVQAEAFDQWSIPGGTLRIHGYCELFDAWHEKDLRALLRRDRNHPSVIMWSIGNEIPELHSDPEKFISLGKELARMVHEEDPTRPVTAACNGARAGFNGIQNVVDVFGFNYFGRKVYDEFRKANPKLPVYGSETVSMGTSRGFYILPATLDYWENTADFHQSSYCQAILGFDYKKPMENWAAPPDIEFATQEKYPFLCGEFIWSGFDYLGGPSAFSALENRMSFRDPEKKAKSESDQLKRGLSVSPLRICEAGLFDTAGLKKDSFYLYQSQWRPELPMAHLLPHWTWPDHVGKIVPVHLFTSGNEAELFLNGQSLGRKSKGPYEYRLVWENVVYEPGELKAVTYKDGKVWAQTVQKTASKPYAIRITADRTRIANDGSDLAFITAEIIDVNGTVVPEANNKVHFQVGKPGRFIATDNGDATDWTSYVSNERKAFSGLLLAIVSFDKTAKNENKKSAFRITASSPGLKSTSLMIESND